MLSRLNHAVAPGDPRNERRLETFHELRRFYRGIPASLADSSGIFFGSNVHFDLVRAGSALYGINPTPGAANPMLPVIGLKARILQVRDLATPESNIGARAKNSAKRRTRLALVSLGYADGYPRPSAESGVPLQVMIGGRHCPVAAAPSIDLLPIDVTDLPDRGVVRFGAMVTLIRWHWNRRPCGGQRIDRARNPKRPRPPLSPHLLRELRLDLDFGSAERAT